MKGRWSDEDDGFKSIHKQKTLEVLHVQGTEVKWREQKVWQVVSVVGAYLPRPRLVLGHEKVGLFWAPSLGQSQFGRSDFLFRWVKCLSHRTLTHPLASWTTWPICRLRSQSGHTLFLSSLSKVSLGTKSPALASGQKELSTLEEGQGVDSDTR